MISSKTWQELHTDEDISSFLEKVDFFHDCCLKEIRYLSGAYVNEDFSMFPVNDKNSLYVLFQSQNQDFPMIEILFSGIILLKLLPVQSDFTCELLDATMLTRNGLFYWFDSSKQLDFNLLDYEGTSICSRSVHWRIINKIIGNSLFYTSNSL